MYGNYKVIVCLPAYNEARNIADIVRLAKNYATEVIVCDDGSVDDTSEAAKSAGATVIRHAINKGYGAAIKTLFEAAKVRGADIMITIDSDGQHNAAQIPDLIQPILDEEADIVIGSRFLERGDSKKVPLYRSVGIKTLTKFAQLASYPNLTDSQSGFRAYGRKAISSFNLHERGMAVSAEILFKAREMDLKIKEVPVTISYEVEDSSTHNPFSHGLSVLTAIIKFISIRHPLASYGIPGVAFILIALYFTFQVAELAKMGYFSTNMIIVAVGSAIIGLILVVTGIILYVLAQKISRHASL